MTVKTWKARPAHYVLMEILKRKGAMTDADLFSALKGELKDIGFKDFNELLMRLEIGGKIHTSSLSRGKRRIELTEGR
jgi:hypothetical protein